MKIDGGEGIREAADPVVVSFKDKYYLFASKSSGYWYSEDLQIGNMSSSPIPCCR